MIRAIDLDIQTMKNNILSYFDLASDRDIQHGQEWYQNTSDLARQWSQEYKKSIEQITGIIAVCSIDASWMQTKKDTQLFLETSGNVKIGRYAMVLNKCRAIYSGQEILPILGNAKIFCFFHNIRYPNKKTRVTIDRHAGCIAISPGSASVDRAYYSTPKKYEVFENAYNLAGQEYGQLGHITQAITWVIHRRLFVDKLPGKRQEYGQE